MGVRIKLNSINEIESPTLVLATRKGKKLGIVPAYNIVFKDCMNSCSEISFRVNKFDNNEECSLWDDILDFKLLWCKEYDLWFEINVEIDENNDLVKNVMGKTVCESELSQINLYNIEINTEDDIAREDYKKPTVFFDEEYSENSLLNRLSEKIPHYTIKHVDNTLADIQKTFSFDDKSIYDAFQEIAEEIGCLFVFGSNSNDDGTIARSISVYDLQSYCEDCGYREEFTDICPKCGSKNISHGYGKDTGIFISTENLADDITYTTNTDSVKNCFKLETGDELMNATIRNCNPNGTDYLWYISDSVKKDMSNDLVQKINDYNDLYNEYQNTHVISINANSAINTYNSLVEKYNIFRAADEKFTAIEKNVVGFPALMNAYYDTIDLKLFLQSGLMPSFEAEETNATKQAALLTKTNMSPVAIPNTSSISKTIADNAVLGIAKIIINNSYTVKINSSSLSGLTWKGNFIVENINDEEDIATSNTISITINSDITTYLGQRVNKALKSKDTDKYSITDLFALDYDDFCSEIEKYSLNCLVSFNDACQAVLDILTEQSSTGNVICDKCGFSGSYKKIYNQICPECGEKLTGVYVDLYYPYYRKLKAIQSEISTRENDISAIDNLQKQIIEIRNDIQDELNFEHYIGKTLWNEFCAYRRENTFSNSNYISDGLDNAELFKRGMEFISAATKEIYKSAELQHSISSTLKNLLAMEEFQSIIQNFEVGNWLRLKVDNGIYKLRLLDYEVDYDDLNNITVTFSDVVKVSGGYSDLESILKQASSMATSYDSVAHQANQGDKGNKRISEWVEKGLALTNSFISNSENQEVVLDSHGFTMKEYLPITDAYSDKQLKIINKGLYVTDDDWETSRAGIGNFIYYDPRDQKTKEGYGVIADTIIGNIILGENVGIYTSTNDITLDKNGIMITNDKNTVTINPNNTNLFTVTNDKGKVLWFDENGNGNFSGKLSIGDSNFVVDENGNVTMSGSITLNGSIDFGDNITFTLYARTNLAKPTGEYSSYSDSSSTTWHKLFDTQNDRFVVYSSDGGKTWGSPQAISYLTHIDSTGIYTGTLTANNIQGGYISTNSDWKVAGTEDSDGYINMFKQIIQFKEQNSSGADVTKMSIGFLRGDTYNEPIIAMGAGTDSNGNGRGYIEKNSSSFDMYYKVSDSTAAYIKMENTGAVKINGVEFPMKTDDEEVINFITKASYWNSKLEAIDSSFGKGSKVVADSDGNTVDISPENLGQMFTVEGSTIHLRPDVVLSWDAVYALYARTNLAKPTGEYSSYSDSSTTAWHKVVSSYDYYVSYSYDGGKTWSTGIQIKGINGTNGSDGADGADGKDGVVDYSQVNTILKNNYNIKAVSVGQSTIEAPIINSATIYSPNIYGTNLTLTSTNSSNSKIYNTLALTPTSMYLTNQYNNTSTKATKFLLDLGQDASNSSIKMRLGAGTNDAGAQALNIEKFENEIRIGTYVNSSGSSLTDFAGMIIQPSTGKVTFTGTVQAVAVFG